MVMVMVSGAVPVAVAAAERQQLVPEVSSVSEMKLECFSRVGHVGHVGRWTEMVFSIFITACCFVIL